MPLNVGDRLGPYAVTAKIGKGGMGEVYRAHDTKLDRDVAVKVLPDKLANDAGALRPRAQAAVGGRGRRGGRRSHDLKKEAVALIDQALAQCDTVLITTIKYYPTYEPVRQALREASTLDAVPSRLRIGAL